MPTRSGTARKENSRERRARQRRFQKRSVCPAKKRDALTPVRRQAQSLNISHQVIEPAAQRAVEPEFGKPSGTAQRTAAIDPCIVLLDRQIEHGDALSRSPLYESNRPREGRGGYRLLCVGIAPGRGR